MTMIEESAAVTAIPAAAAEPRAAAPTMSRPTVRRPPVVGMLTILAGLAAWLPVYAAGLSALHEHHAQSVLYSQLREELANATAPLAGHIAEGAPVAIIDAPSGGIHREVVVEGTTSRDLQSGPGHYPGTVLPGQAGIATIMGKAITYGAPFGSIATMHVGDVITTTTDQGVSHYTVTELRKPGDPLPSPLTPDAGRLTLVTAANSGWRGGWTPTHAIFVDAMLQSKPFTTPATSPAAGSADAPMAGDSGALVPLVLWLQGLLLSGLAVAWGRHRWGARETWLVGGVVLLALLWGASGAFVSLLPNLF